VLQEDVNHFYLVLPPSLPPFSSELNDEELEAVAGGAAKPPEPKPTTEPVPPPTYERPKCACLCMGTTTAPGPEA